MSKNPPSKKSKAVAPDQENTASENAVLHDHTALIVASTGSRILRSRSGNTEDQRALALGLLKTSPQTTYSLRAKGISHSGARIMELRKLGYPIVTTPVTTVDSDGYSHARVALYSLEAV